MSEPEGSIRETYARMRDAIRQACLDAGRDETDVRLLPVSKTHPVSLIREAMVVGCMRFAENRVQEMVTKAQEMGPEVSWELIGHLQRNKVGAACAVMSQLQSLDSLELALALERQYSATRFEERLDVLVEVNTSGEETKYGVGVDEVGEFTRALQAYPHLNPRGLMTIAHPDPGLAEQGFKVMAHLRQCLRERDGGGWDELSMGMSGEFEAAIAHGSTCVRIGTAIFGHRSI